MHSVLILSALLAVGTLSSSTGWLLKIVLAAALFLIPSVLWFSISMSKAKKYLFEELNPFKYYAVMGVYGKNLTEDNYEFNYAVGNYEKAVSLCLKEMSKTKLKQIEVECKYYLALCYFETENYEKLRIVCDELKAVFSSDKNGKVYKQQYGLVLDYFIDFLNGDYEKCKNIKSCTELTDKKYSNFYRVKAQFYYAVALYKNNEIFNDVEIRWTCNNSDKGVSDNIYSYHLWQEGLYNFTLSENYYEEKLIYVEIELDKVDSIYQAMNIYFLDNSKPSITMEQITPETDTNFSSLMWCWYAKNCTLEEGDKIFFSTRLNLTNELYVLNGFNESSMFEEIYDDAFNGYYLLVKETHVFSTILLEYDGSKINLFYEYDNK